MGSSESRSAKPVVSPPGRHPTTGEGGHSHALGSLLKLVGDSTARPFGATAARAQSASRDGGRVRGCVQRD